MGWNIGRLLKDISSLYLKKLAGDRLIPVTKQSLRARAGFVFGFLLLHSLRLLCFSEDMFVQALACPLPSNRIEWAHSLPLMGNLGAILYLGLSITLFWVLCGFLEGWLATDLPSFDRECGVVVDLLAGTLGVNSVLQTECGRKFQREQNEKNKFQVLLKCFLCFWNKNIPLFSHFWELHYQARSVIKGRNSYLTILLVCLCAVWDFCRERMQICTDLLIQDKASTTDQARILL